MRWHTTDYLNRDDDPRPGRRVHRGFWLEELPRLMLVCRLRGHRPVVDGYGPTPPGTGAARWVVCDRCGVRPEPQGRLDPDGWRIGQPYDGPYAGEEMNDPLLRTLLGPGNTFVRGGMHLPGTWPGKPTGTLGGELVIGKTWDLLSVQVKVGNAGSEHVLAAHLGVWPFGILYLHTERFGTWLQRRLNPTGYESRVIGLDIGGWKIRTQVWARRDHWSRDDPWWMHGRISLDLVEKVFGRKRYSYTDHDTSDGLVCLGNGEVHPVRLTLQRQRLGRPRLEWRARYSWVVEWVAADSEGIPVRPGRGTVSAAVEVDDDAVTSGQWGPAARAAIAEKIAQERARYGYRAPTGTEN
ncbi:hypothetical protein [Nonomuraea wenchangensis]|uniref:Uncharacterized protein n=1 Tax=Nonomuraea wenchangensis TaxID=568860 RepID=A0A1I0LV68_9ACTN|nr:hypothetical protein [Nonomuraea wenchangensis]SEU46555.1 hypothetical protein SAMN05421811_12777 [Nonomuraea wenchangensis]